METVKLNSEVLKTFRQLNLLHVQRSKKNNVAVSHTCSTSDDQQADSEMPEVQFYNLLFSYFISKNMLLKCYQRKYFQNFWNILDITFDN